MSEQNEGKGRAFNPKNLDDALETPQFDFDCERKLLVLREYMLACAECIHAENLQVVDPERILRRFEEVYLAATSLVRDIDVDLAERLKQIESEAHLSQNVVRLGAIAKDAIVTPSFWEKLASRIDLRPIALPGVILALRNEETSRATTEALLDIRVALDRVAGLLGTGARRAKEHWLSAQDVLVIDGYYDPRRAPKGLIAVKLNNALEALRTAQGLPSPIRDALVREVASVIEELGQTKTPWNKVLSRLTQVMLLLAALVSAGADIDDAYKNVRSALEYISQASVSQSNTPPLTPLPFSSKNHEAALPADSSAPKRKPDDQEDEGTGSGL